jgi:hypothetical protein
MGCLTIKAAFFYETQLNLPVQKQADAHTLVAMLAEAEATSKINLRTNLYLRLAGCATEQIHCSHERNLNKEQLLFFSELSFVENGAKFLSQGPRGAASLTLPALWGVKPVCWATKLFITNLPAPWGARPVCWATKHVITP